MPGQVGPSDEHVTVSGVTRTLML